MPLSAEEQESNKTKQNCIPLLLTKVTSKKRVFGDDKTLDITDSPVWPRIAQESTLFGLSAYNPRGQESPLETNKVRQALLSKDIQDAIKFHTSLTFWDAFGVWEDGSSEPGFILAFPHKMEHEGLVVSKTLAKKYNQGAIYRFKLDKKSKGMMRETIAVLVEQGCEARVQIEIDDVSGSDIDVGVFVQQSVHPEQ